MERISILWAFVPFLLFELILGCEPIVDGEEPPSLDQRGQLPALINITGLGHLCQSSNLVTGMTYVLLLDRVDRSYEPASAELDGEIYFEELLFICDLQPHYPLGVTADSSAEECPAVESECISFTPANDPTTTKPEKDVKYDHNNSNEEKEAEVEDVKAAGASSGTDDNGGVVPVISTAVVAICVVLSSLLV
ncbi:hypothetical protein ScPMuIL_008985 [Solemya velum]